MTRRLRRGGAVLFALALVPGLSACNKAALDPATNLVVADNGTGATKTDSILARAIVLVKSKDAKASALAGTLINRADAADTLQTIEIRTAPNATPIVLSPGLALKPHEVIRMGTESHEPLTVQDNGALLVGHFVDVVMRFAKAGDIKVEVPVELRDRYYSGIVPATGTTTTQAERKLSDCGTTKAGKPSAACAAAEAAAKAAPKAAGTAEEATAVTGKAATTTAPAAKAAARSTAKREKAAAAEPAATAPKAAPAEHEAGHDPSAPAH